MDLLVIESGLDQPDNSDPTSLLNGVDSIMRRAIQTQDMNMAMGAAKTFISTIKQSGIALAKTLFLLQSNWMTLGGASGEFENECFINLGLSLATVRRYTRVWEMFESKEIPAEIAQDLQKKGIKDLVPIATAWASGYDIKEDEWKKLADAGDNNTVLSEIREIKGVEPRSNSLVIRLDREGSLYAFQDGERVFVGNLETSSENLVVKKAIARILSIGIMSEG